MRVEIVLYLQNKVSADEELIKKYNLEVGKNGFALWKFTTDKEAEEIEKDFRNSNLLSERIISNVVIEPIFDNIWEWCGECDSELNLKSELKIHTCPYCGAKLKPCALCSIGVVNCGDCYIDKLEAKANG